MDKEIGVADTSQPSSEDDASILARVQSGDEGVMSSLFDRHARVVYSIALRVLRDPTSAEDVLQEVFLQIWRSPDSFVAARGSLGGWLAVVARNCSVDALRRKRPSASFDGIALAASVHPVGEAERSALAERARAAIRELPRAQRKVLEMAFFDGLTHTEIAEMTGDPKGAAKTAIRGALLTLRKALQP